ncbi:MAG: hypothetical protein ACLUFV_07285 [Acutalibacteraceae bacterium]
MDSVHAFPPHNVSNRLSYVESFVIFCIYGGLRRQNKQAAINGSHKKRSAAECGLCKKAGRKEIPLLSCLSFGEKQKIRNDKPSFGARRTHPQPERRGAATAVCRRYRRR